MEGGGLESSSQVLETSTLNTLTGSHSQEGKKKKKRKKKEEKRQLFAAAVQSGKDTKKDSEWQQGKQL